MALLFILLVIAGGMGLSVEAGLLGPLASQVGDLWATMSIFGIGAVLTFFLMLFFSPRSSTSQPTAQNRSAARHGADVDYGGVTAGGSGLRRGNGYDSDHSGTVRRRIA